MISIIIPIYNAEKYLRRTADCIRSQSLTDFEVLLINDGSTDDSERICLDLQQTDSRFRLISQRNSGVSAARNRGLQEARGEYITFLDADDVIPQNYLEELHTALTEQNAQMSVCDVAVIRKGTETGRFTCKSNTLTQTESMNLLLSRREINSGPCAKLFRRETLVGLQFPPLRAYEDILFVADAMNRCDKVAATNRTEYRYEQNEDSAMGSFRKMPSLDVVTASGKLAELTGLRSDLSPECLYTTLSHLMQYVQPLVGNPDEQARLFVSESRNLMRSQTAAIRKCTAFPWKEKIIFILFAHGWFYGGHKLSKI